MRGRFWQFGDRHLSVKRLRLRLRFRMRERERERPLGEWGVVVAGFTGWPDKKSSNDSPSDSATALVVIRHLTISVRLFPIN